MRGEVARPGIYPLRDGQDRISDLIRSAGGFLPTAARRSVLVVRRSGSTLERDPEFDRLSRLSRQEMTEAEYQTFRTKLAAAQSNYLVNAEGLMDGAKGSQRDVLLQDDDLVVVDRREHAVRVTGRVRQPGLVEYEPAFRGQDYVDRAGGYAEGASPKRARVTRASSGQTVLLKDAGTIDPGDLIYIPEAPEKHVASMLRDLLIAAGSIATIVIAFRN
jgi:protein involved in polysaccharide export with SLBB domain